MRLRYPALAIVAATIAAFPIWIDQARSTIQWAQTEQPAKCFGRNETEIFGFRPRACTQWNHCAADNAKNIERGYTCRQTVDLFCDADKLPECLSQVSTSLRWRSPGQRIIIRDRQHGALAFEVD